MPLERSHSFIFLSGCYPWSNIAVSLVKETLDALTPYFYLSWGLWFLDVRLGSTLKS